MQTNKLTASALLICTCVIWGIQPMFAKFVVREMSPIPMVSIRYTIVALTLFAMLAWRGEKLLPPRRTWPALFTMGILGVCINNVTQFTGLQYSTVTNFTIIATLTPIVTALLSFVLIHERLHRLQWLGICSSLCGGLAGGTRSFFLRCAGGCLTGGSRAGRRFRLLFIFRNDKRRRKSNTDSQRQCAEPQAPRCFFAAHSCVPRLAR